MNKKQRKAFEVVNVRIGILLSRLERTSPIDTAYQGIKTEYEALKELFNLASSGWRPIESGLPEKDGLYLTTEIINADILGDNDEPPQVSVCSFIDGEFRQGLTRVIAWKPLPSPYTPDYGGEK